MIRASCSVTRFAVRRRRGSSRLEAPSRISTSSGLPFRYRATRRASSVPCACPKFARAILRRRSLAFCSALISSSSIARRCRPRCVARARRRTAGSARGPVRLGLLGLDLRGSRDSGSASGRTASASSRMRGDCHLVGRIHCPCRGTVRRTGNGPGASHKAGMLAGLSDERQTGYIACRRCGADLLERCVPDGPLPLVGCLPRARGWLRMDPVRGLARRSRPRSSPLRRRVPTIPRRSAARPSGSAQSTGSQPRLSPSSTSTRSRPGSAAPRPRLAALGAAGAPRGRGGIGRRSLTIARQHACARRARLGERLRDPVRRGRGRPAGGAARRRVPRRRDHDPRRARPRRRPGRRDPRPGAAARGELRRSAATLAERRPRSRCVARRGEPPSARRSRARGRSGRPTSRARAERR